MFCLSSLPSTERLWSPGDAVSTNFFVRPSVLNLSWLLVRWSLMAFRSVTTEAIIADGQDIQVSIQCFFKIIMRKLKIHNFFFKNPQSLYYIWTFDYLYLKNASSEGSKVKFSFYSITGNLDNSWIRCSAQLFGSKKNVQVALWPFTKKSFCWVFGLRWRGEVGRAHAWSRQSLHYQNRRPIWRRVQQTENELGWR